MSAQTVLKFIIALLPLFIIIVGILAFNQRGDRMAVVGWLLCVIIAVGIFKTDLNAALAASLIGFLKAFGISIAVVFTMLMIFIMKEKGCLGIISEFIKKLTTTIEGQALFIGVGFGTFLTSLGIVTPALFPPLLVAMGFNPFSAVAIAVLGYNATTSFALLALPITLPAEIGGFDAADFAFKITLYLPVVSVGISLAILWMVGGVKSMKKGMIPAIISGLAIAFSAIFFTYTEIVPLRIVGVASGLVTMAALLLYQKVVSPNKKSDANHTRTRNQIALKPLLIAFSPWIILTILACIISIESVGERLSEIGGEAEIIEIYGEKVDLNIFNQIYTWIFVSILIALPLLKPTKTQLNSALKLWVRRVWPPFIAYSVYFMIAFVMAKSAFEIQDGAFVQIGDFNDFNMNVIVGTSLASLFGAGYIFVAGSVGMMGAFAGGSAASSNVMFYGIQQNACKDAGVSGLTNEVNQQGFLKLDGDGGDFMTVYGAHAVACGAASNNPCKNQ